MLTELSTRSRTLVVDDDEVMREVLAALLDLQGHDVHVVDSGAAALQWLETSPAPHLVLTDMQMPGMEVSALVEALRGAIHPPTLLFGMSGSRPQQPVLDSLDAFVLKPFGYGDLETALHDRHRPDGPHERRGTDSGSTAGLVPPSSTDGAQMNFAQLRGDSGSGEAQPVLDETIFDSLHRSFRTAQLEELYALTLNDVTVRHRRLEAYAAAGDTEAARREAHSVKGLCGMVGARELGALAAAVEAGTTLDTSAITEISAACARLRRMLDTKFGNPTAPAGEHE